MSEVLYGITVSRFISQRSQSLGGISSIGMVERDKSQVKETMMLYLGSALTYDLLLSLLFYTLITYTHWLYNMGYMTGVPLFITAE